jgi:transcription antitermination factor NusG
MTEQELWFALRVRNRHEYLVSTTLGNKGYETFLPVYKVRRQWSDRSKAASLPLFPTYLFCRLDPENRLPVLVTPGVLAIVGTGKRPVPIEEDEIEAVRRISASGLPVTPWPGLEIGRKVWVEHGPLRGVEGVILDDSRVPRLLVGITLLQRSISVEVDSGWLAPLEHRPAAAQRPDWERRGSPWPVGQTGARPEAAR